MIEPKYKTFLSNPTTYTFFLILIAGFTAAKMLLSEKDASLERVVKQQEKTERKLEKSDSLNHLLIDFTARKKEIDKFK